MATIVFKNAKMFVNDSDFATQLTELQVDYSVEMLDATTFGYNTRINKGGLTNSRISGKGFFDGGSQSADRILFSDMGVDDAVITVFPDGITEGDTVTMGYGLKGVLSEFNLGGAVGTLLSFDMAAEGRGINAV